MGHDIVALSAVLYTPNMNTGTYYQCTGRYGQCFVTDRWMEG